MNIVETDELTHVASDDWLWREGLYFNFHDASGSIGGTTTISIRPNQGHYEAMVVLFLNDHREVRFYQNQGDLGKNSLYSAPGIEYKLVNPLREWHIKVEADLLGVERVALLQGSIIPKDATPTIWHLDFEAIQPAFALPVYTLEGLGVAAEHYEQCGHVKGDISIGGKTFAIEGLGFRDHSWGIRDLAKTGNMGTFIAQFGPDFTTTVAWERIKGQEANTGYIWRDDVNDPVIGARIFMDTNRHGLPIAAAAAIQTGAGHHFWLQAVVNAAVPIVLEQGDIRLRWYQCSAHFRSRGRSGHGIMEITSLLGHKE